MNKNLITKKNTDLVLNKSKSTLNITSKILSGKTSLTTEIIEDWIKEIWSWADENGIDRSTIPRSKDLLLALETIDLSGLELYSITSRLCFLEDVTSLILEDNNMEELPKEIVNFRNLMMLNLKNNPFTLTYTQERWTEQLKDKGCVVHLSSDLVEYSQNKDLVDESWIERLWVWADENYIPDLTWVENERLKNGGFWKGLPRTKDKLLSFTELDLRKRKWGKQLLELPKEIGNLTNLAELDLGSNKLTELPREIGNLTNLTRLSLWSNKLTELPKEIGNLPNLTELGLWSNKLIELPKEIWCLINLTYLNLNYNQLAEVPKEIGNLPNLTELGLGGNSLEELPKEIWKLTNLTELGLGGNNLAELPKEIGNITSLTRLDLGSNNLTKLPKEIGSLANLTGLDLGVNNLAELPKEIGNITSLARLDLWGNKLTELPKEIENLTYLTELNLGGNRELILTKAQKEWIGNLLVNDCEVDLYATNYNVNSLRK